MRDEDLLREVMNTVGKPGKLGGDIRCVVHPRVMQGRAGHAASKLTMELYAHVPEAADRQAADALIDSAGRLGPLVSRRRLSSRAVGRNHTVG